jgi:EAL domain-containing protein (putative c-di-GMP-specific phosphodiesterase class I)
MPSSTTAHASHHLLLRAAAARAQRRYRGTAGRPSDASGFSSPAGLHRRPWLARLRQALENDLFVLHYQPIVSLRDGRVSHYEALVRLADEPHGRLVAPGSFLPAAERYGLVRDIDRLVLGRVAALLAGQPGRRGPTVAINVSTLSATDGRMLTHIERALTRRAVDPSRLIVEVTETAAISDMGRARAFCEGVQALGCAVALDDFGSGFGSFQYLKHLPFDFLKIDGDFIRALPDSPTDQLVVKALVDVVGGMGRQTIAEFVGDGTTLRMLGDYGVDYAQGYEVGRPAPRLPVPA